VQLQKTTYFHINYKLQAIKIVREKLYKKGLDTKGVIRIRKSKTMQDNELHRKPKIGVQAYVHRTYVSMVIMNIMNILVPLVSMEILLNWLLSLTLFPHS
jgi:hypothetical protein